MDFSLDEGTPMSASGVHAWILQMCRSFDAWDSDPKLRYHWRVITGESELFSQLDFNAYLHWNFLEKLEVAIFVVIDLLGVFTEDKLDPTAKDQLCDARKQNKK